MEVSNFFSSVLLKLLYSFRFIKTPNICMYDIKRCNTYQHLMFVNACCSYLRTFRAVVCVCWGVVSGEKLMDGLYRVVHLFATLLSQADQL